MGTMATQSPFSLLEGLLQNFNLPFTPPAWAVDELHRRIVLLLNHVLMQEPQAMERLARQKGRVVRMQWRDMTFVVVVTPAGLLDVAAPDQTTDLSLFITEESPLAIAESLMAGNKPAVRIDGDVQLAADVSWLIDHVRWDLEEDLSRILGDAPAHGLMQVAVVMAQGVRQFAGRSSKDTHGGSSA
jgi:ubiquinone biosynthesis protein UbiJ